MNHSDIQALMADYLEGGLSLGKRALFDGHLDGCEACATELVEMRRTIGMLRALPTPEPPADLVDNVMHRIREGETRVTWLDRAGGWVAELASPRIAIPATALAAAAVIALFTGDLQLDLPGTPERARPRQLAAAPPQQTLERVEIPAAGDRLAKAPARAPAIAPEGESAAQPSPTARIARVAESVQRPPAAGASESPVRANPDASVAPGGQRNLQYVEARPAREPAPILRRGPSRLDEPAGILPVAGQPELTRPVMSTIPKEQRRLIELDGRLNFLLQQPDEFARWMSSFTMAEQELWLEQLAERAEERGLVEAVGLALSESDDATGQSLATAFASAAERNNPSNVVSPETEPASN